MSIIIHQTSVSPPARATLIVADLLGLKVQAREVNLPGRDHFKPEYLKKNPLHTVPLLEDGDLVLADSHAISTYLVSKYGGEQQNLYPKDLAVRATVDQRLYFDATILFPRLKAVIYGVLKEKTRITEQQVADIIECYSITETYLAKPYIAAVHLTLADVSCVTTISSLDCIVPVDKKYVKLHEWWKRLREETWYQKINEPGLRSFSVWFNKIVSVM